MTADKKTFPSLAVQIGETVYYGALFTYPANPNTIRLDVNGTLYWAGVYCAAGTYSAKGHEPCSDCGAGYYCTGWLHRAACTYGSKGCPGANHTADDLPVLVTNGLIVHLDAIKNTAAGHNPGATVWSDLSGNNNHFEFMGPAPAIGPSSITLNQIDQYARSVNALQIAGYSAITVEIRYKVVNPAHYVMIFEHTLNSNIYPGAVNVSSNNSGYAYSANECFANQYPTGSGATAVTYNCNVNDLEFHTAVITFSSVPNPTGRLFYFDAVLLPSNGRFPNGSELYKPFSNAQSFIGRRGDGTDVWAQGASNMEINSLRIYNRQLSPAEICQNAWADYNRFGGAAPGC